MMLVPLLRAFEGPVAPEAWRGALPFTYHVGPGKATVHLKLEFRLADKRTARYHRKNARKRFPDEWVIRGNHHDAWVNGANDPLSGQAAMLEEARSLGIWQRAGWKPKRTSFFAPGMEKNPDLLGSTEWVELHSRELVEKAVTYINTDGVEEASCMRKDSHALEPFRE